MNLKHLASALVFALPALAQTTLAPELQRESLAMLRELIGINTTDSVGDNTAAARAVAKRLLDAGFPASDVQVLIPPGRPNKGNLVARLRGKAGGPRPILFLGHLDVVEARREDWTSNPFELLEKDGYLYGRGTQDMKANDVTMIQTFIRLKREGVVPPRDLILALTSDEEGGTANGADWLLKEHRGLVDAEFALNADNGGVTTEKGKTISVEVGAAEKLYADFQLEVTNPGGHSSRPPKENAIYQLAHALERLEKSPFPFELNPVTRAFFASVAARETPEKKAAAQGILAAKPLPAALEAITKDPRYNALTHTTCIPTRLDAGHANNALPQMARAIVNCRILPGHSAEEIRLELIRKLNDGKVSVRYVDGSTNKVEERAPDVKAMTPAEPRKDVMGAIGKTADSFWPGAPVVITMSTGASDSKYTAAAQIPSYGIGLIAVESDDNRAHGKDERIRTSSFYEAVEFNYRFVKALTGTN